MVCFEVHFWTTQNDFLHKIMVVQKNFFSSNAEHNSAKGKVISKCKNDKP